MAADNPQNAESRLAVWFRQWRTDLRKYLIGRGLAQTADLDDIAQEVFLRLLRYDRAELVEHPKAYLFRMASNLAAEWSLRARVRRPHDAKWLADLHAGDTPEQATARQGAQDEVERAIKGLPPRQREVLKAHINEDLSVAEIAARLGATKRMVKRDLTKSYARLRNELDIELMGDLPYG